MPEPSPISSDVPCFHDITMALARTVNALLGNLEKTRANATLYIEIRDGKLKGGDVKLPLDFSDAQ